MEDVDDEMEDVEHDDMDDEFRGGSDDDDVAASEEFNYSVCYFTIFVSASFFCLLLCVHIL